MMTLTCRLLVALTALMLAPDAALANCAPPEPPETTGSGLGSPPPETVLVWVHQGLLLRQMPLPQPDQSLRERLTQLRCEGCTQSGVRYSDTASMAPAQTALDWPDAVARLATVGAVADDPEVALSALTEARESGGLDAEQQAILTNQAILTALQMGDWTSAEAALSEAGLSPQPGLRDPLRADRLFWRVLLDTEGHGRPWSDTHFALLDEAAQLDPESFQVRFWRLVGWIAVGQRQFPGDCPGKVDAFVDLAFDAAQGSTCPLMMAHMGHTLERQFQLRPEGTLGSRTAVWLRGYAGVNAALVGNHGAARAAQADLVGNSLRNGCAPDLAAMIERILDSQ